MISFRLLRRFMPQLLRVDIASSHAKRSLKLVPCLGAFVYAAENRQLQPPNPQDLTHTYLIKNASIATVDSGSSLLTQVACALLEAHQQYQLALVEVIKLMELNLQVLGEEVKEELVWDALLKARSDVSYWKTEKENLETALTCAERSLEAAAEAAHIAGAVYAGITASERLFSVKSRVREAQEKSEKSEAELRLLEMETIQKTADHEEKMKMQKREAEEVEESTPTTDQSEDQDQSEEKKNDWS